MANFQPDYFSRTLKRFANKIYLRWSSRWPANDEEPAEKQVVRRWTSGRALVRVGRSGREETRPHLDGGGRASPSFQQGAWQASLLTVWPARSLAGSLLRALAGPLASQPVGSLVGCVSLPGGCASAQLHNRANHLPPYDRL